MEKAWLWFGYRTCQAGGRQVGRDRAGGTVCLFGQQGTKEHRCRTGGGKMGQPQATVYAHVPLNDGDTKQTDGYFNCSNSHFKSTPFIVAIHNWLTI
jgi:hypothetical protein